MKFIEFISFFGNRFYFRNFRIFIISQLIFLLEKVKKFGKIKRWEF